MRNRISAVQVRSARISKSGQVRSGQLASTLTSHPSKPKWAQSADNFSAANSGLCSNNEFSPAPPLPSVISVPRHGTYEGKSLGVVRRKQFWRAWVGMDEVELGWVMHGGWRLALLASIDPALGWDSDTVMAKVAEDVNCFPTVKAVQVIFIRLFAIPSDGDYYGWRDPPTTDGDSYGWRDPPTTDGDYYGWGTTDGEYLRRYLQ